MKSQSVHLRSLILFLPMIMLMMGCQSDTTSGNIELKSVIEGNLTWDQFHNWQNLADGKLDAVPDPEAQGLSFLDSTSGDFFHIAGLAFPGSDLTMDVFVRQFDGSGKEGTYTLHFQTRKGDKLIQSEDLGSRSGPAWYENIQKQVQIPDGLNPEGNHEIRAFINYCYVITTTANGGISVDYCPDSPEPVP